MKPIEDILEDICDEIDDSRIIPNYSGRGMFGKTCPAVSTSTPITAIEEAAAMGMRGAVIDSLGMGSVVYWPRYKLETQI
jgi:hypothetical protein